MDTLVSLKNIRKIFRKPVPLEVISEISFDIERHEFVSLVGPVGCGKTTLLLMIANLIKPSSGEIIFNGCFGDRDTPNTGLVFQEFNRSLFGWRSVRGNIEFGLEVRRIKKQKRKEIVDKMLELLKLTKFQSYYPGQISGGMKQKTALGRALAYEPEVLLMDEPFGSLDGQTKKWLVKEVDRIHEATKKTTLMVTHYVEEALCLSDRIIVLSDKPCRIKKVFSLDPDLRKNKDVKFWMMKEEIENMIT